MPANNSEKTWFIYLIKTAQGSLYTGITTDIAKRLSTHESGKGAKYLRGKGPLELVTHQIVANRSLATRLEYQIKRLSAQDKLRVMSNTQLFANFAAKHQVE
ncbi:MAG: GIY-YIG nuclease family protein [Gammaproteobacteria bacterium]|nr:GIY-YIG nuclease family protein [Gammaproteobacteria bacterium]